MRLCAALFIVSALLSGCRGRIADEAPLNRMTVSPELASAVEGIRIVDSSEIARIIRPISATACQKLAADPEPSNEYAVALLKQEALKAKAIAIARLQFSDGSRSDCFASLVADGLAVTTP